MKMMNYRIANIFIFLFLTINTYALDQDIPDPVQIKIITDTETVEPGTMIKVGVYFKVDPGWHIYWKNPGDSGLPTKVKHLVPEGFEIKQTHYPVPKTFLREGNILDYGYEDELLLITDIYVPKDTDIKKFKIKSEALWVVCKEVCIAGSREIELQFPVNNTDIIEDDVFFMSWQSQLPVRINKDRHPFHYSVVKKFNEQKKLKQVDITFNWESEVKDVNIFPNTGRSIYLKNINLINDKKISYYGFSPVIFKNDIKDIKEIEFVISYKETDGQIKRIETLLDLSG